MPTIAVKKRLLDKHLGESLSREDIDNLCFLYGLEVDDVVSGNIEKIVTLLDHKHSDHREGWEDWRRRRSLQNRDPG